MMIVQRVNQHGGLPLLQEGLPDELLLSHLRILSPLRMRVPYNGGGGREVKLICVATDLL